LSIKMRRAVAGAARGGGTAEETLGQRLRRLRKERGLSQRQLAQPGVSYAYVSRVEAGQRQPSVKAIRLLAARLGVSPEFLETGKPLSAHDDRQLRLDDAELALRLQGDAPGAEREYRRVLEEALEVGDSVAATRAEAGLALAVEQQGRYDEAVEHLEALVASGKLSVLSRPDVFMALGRAYAARGSYQDAVDLFERCLADLRSREPTDRAIELRFTTYLSCALADAGKLEDAREVVLEATQHEHEVDPAARVQLNWSSARIASMTGDAAAAMDSMRVAIALLQSSEDTHELAVAYLLCSQILVLDGRASEARPYLDRAERLLTLGTDSVNLGALRTQQAFVAVAEQRPEEAIERAHEALELLAEHELAQGATWYALGKAFAAKGDVERAIPAFKRAVDLLADTGEWREATAAARAWSEVLRTAGKTDEALDVLEQASELAARSIPAAPRPGRTALPR
jgi:tetratricopeptide (TPR) repeat protein